MTVKHEPDETRLDLEDAAHSAQEKEELQSRRMFLISLGKWSRAVIVGAVASGAMLSDNPARAGWVNRRGCCRGGGWINGGNGGSWANRRGGGWGGSWINKR